MHNDMHWSSKMLDFFSQDVIKEFEKTLNIAHKSFYKAWKHPHFL